MGAYLTEAAERKRDLEELNRYTLTNLNDARIGQASRVAVVTVALIDGLAPLLAALIVLIPFFAVDLFPTVVWVYRASLGVALLGLFSLGSSWVTSRGEVWSPTGSGPSLPGWFPS